MTMTRLLCLGAAQWLTPSPIPSQTRSGKLIGVALPASNGQHSFGRVCSEPHTAHQLSSSSALPGSSLFFSCKAQRERERELTCLHCGLTHAHIITAITGEAASYLRWVLLLLARDASDFAALDATFVGPPREALLQCVRTAESSPRGGLAREGREVWVGMYDIVGTGRQGRPQGMAACLSVRVRVARDAAWPGFQTFPIQGPSMPIAHSSLFWRACPALSFVCLSFLRKSVGPVHNGLGPIHVLGFRLF